MTRPWNNPDLVAKTPLAAVVFLESANVGQLWRMWHVHSALGQNLASWLAVQCALWLWINFYRVLVPKEKRGPAMAGTAVGIILNACVCLTVIYFHSR